MGKKKNISNKSNKGSKKAKDHKSNGRLQRIDLSEDEEHSILETLVELENFSSKYLQNKSSKIKSYKDFNARDKKLYITKLIRDDRFKRKLEEKGDNDARKLRYEEKLLFANNQISQNVNDGIETLNLEDNIQSVNDIHSTLENKYDKGVEYDDDDSSSDSEVDDPLMSDIEDDLDNRINNTEETLYWKPPITRHHHHQHPHHDYECITTRKKNKDIDAILYIRYQDLYTCTWYNIYSPYINSNKSSHINSNSNSSSNGNNNSSSSNSSDQESNNVTDTTISHITHSSTNITPINNNTTTTTTFESTSYLINIQQLHEELKTLPIYAYKDTIIQSIRNHQTTLICGETGSGKTTQLPTYIYHDMIQQQEGSNCMIIVTQPRRIAAISVAERVAFEHNEKIGETIGYQVRLNACYSHTHTRILYCTTGILLKKLQTAEFLNQVSHIIIDEVHERQMETDFLLTLLKNQKDCYPHLKLVLMSATIQEELFSSYFQCPIVRVPGRMYPVTIKYMEDCHSMIRQAQLRSGDSEGRVLPSHQSKDTGRFSRNKKSQKNKGKSKRYTDESDDEDIDNSENTKIKSPEYDSELVAEMIIRIIETYSPPPPPSPTIGIKDEDSTGSSTSTQQKKGNCILVFLSGLQAIQHVSRLLKSRSLSKYNAYVLILHSSIQTSIQSRVFEPTQINQWKIILSTNIAETSVTVNDVTHVIDTGFHKEMRYDVEAKMSCLNEVFVSRASANQRCGRAGRVQSGICWRMYSQEYLECSEVSEYSLPEMQRLPLNEVILQVVLLELGSPRVFLHQCPEPPSPSQIDLSLNTLLTIKAILPYPPMYPLTALGYHLARLPLDVQVGKMLIYAGLLQCIEPALTIAAVLSGKWPYFIPPNKMEEASNKHLIYSKQFVTTSYLIQEYMNTHPFTTTTTTTTATTTTTSNRNSNSNANDVYNVIETDCLTMSDLARYKKTNKKTNKKTSSKNSLYTSQYLLFSDHIAVTKIFDVWNYIRVQYGREHAFQYCLDNYLSYNILVEIQLLRDQFRMYLHDIGFENDKFNTMGIQTSLLHKIKQNSIYTTTHPLSTTTTTSTNNRTHKHISKYSTYHSNDDNDDDDEYDYDDEDSDENDDDDDEEENDDDFITYENFIRCALCAGLSPNIVRGTKYHPISNTDTTTNTTSGNSKRLPISKIPTKLYEKEDREIFIHPTSCNMKYVQTMQKQSSETSFDGFIRDIYLIYHKKVATNKVCIYDCTMIPIISVLLFSGNIHIAKNYKSIQVDKWISIKMKELHAVLIRRLQQEWDKLLQDKVETATTKTIISKYSNKKNNKMIRKTSERLMTNVENPSDNLDSSTLGNKDNQTGDVHVHVQEAVDEIYDNNNDDDDLYEEYIHPHHEYTIEEEDEDNVTETEGKVTETEGKVTETEEKVTEKVTIMSSNELNEQFIYRQNVLLALLEKLLDSPLT